MKKTISNLVLGSEGFVGKALCEYLERKGEKATHFDIKRNKSEDARKANLSLDSFDRVYFLAWEVGGAKYLYRNDTQLIQLSWNLDLLNNVMLQLQKHKTPFLFVSSQMAEKADTIYGTLKKLGEFWTRELNGACVRLWNPYGAPEELSEKSHVVADFVNQAVSTGKIKMMTTGEEERQFTHMDDICEGLHYTMENHLYGRVFDLTSYKWVSIMQVAEIISAYAKAKIIPGKAKGIVRSNVPIKGLPPGWKPKIGLSQGLKKMVDEARHY